MVHCVVFRSTLRVELRVVWNLVYKRPKVSILLTEKLLTLELFEICFMNLNQLYIEYICCGWFEYFRVCWTYQWYFGELNIVCGVWNELCDCVLRLGVLNIVNWCCGMFVDLGVLSQIVLEHIALEHGCTILGLSDWWDSVIEFVWRPNFFFFIQNIS
jgi:hypothetical protein